MADLTTNATIDSIDKKNIYRAPKQHYGPWKYIQDFLLIVIFLPISLSILITFLLNHIIRFFQIIFFSSDKKKYSLFYLNFFKFLFLLVFIAGFAFLFFILFFGFDPLCFPLGTTNELSTLLKDKEYAINGYQEVGLIFRALFQEPYKTFGSFTYIGVILLWYVLNLTIYVTPFLMIISCLLMLFCDGVFFDMHSNHYDEVEQSVKKGEKKAKISYHRRSNHIALYTGYNMLWTEFKKAAEKRLIDENRLTPANGQIVSFEKNSQIFFQRKFWNKHVLFLGARKSGKTNDILCWLVSGLCNKQPIIFFNHEKDDATFYKFKAMSDELYVPFYSWKTKYQNESFLRYSPFYDKSPSECKSMIEYTLLKKIKADDPVKILIKLILNYMLITTPVINFAVLENFTDLNYLKNVYSSTPIDNESDVHRGIREVIANAIVDPNHLIYSVHKQIVKFNQDISNLIIIDGSKQENFISFKSIINFTIPIFYVNFSNNFTDEMNGMLQRLFYLDLIYTVQKNKAKNIMLAINELPSLFNTLQDVHDTLKQWNDLSFNVAVDIFISEEKTYMHPLHAELINTIPNQFIHNIANQDIYNVLDKILSNSRFVKPLFQFDDLSNKIHLKYVNEATVLSEEEKANKLNLITNIKAIPPNNVLFKTIYSNNDIYKSHIIKTYPIVYNRYIKSVFFDDYLHYMRKFFHGIELDRSKLDKIVK